MSQQALDDLKLALEGLATEDREVLVQNLAMELSLNLDDPERKEMAHYLENLKQAADAPRCQHVKANGKTCASPAMNDNAFCYFHHEARTRKPNKYTCRQFDMPVLEDQRSIQVAVSRVCQLIADDFLDAKRGGVLLYGLQIAGANLKNRSSLME